MFWGLVGVVALAPLPLGSNRAWAWSALALLIGLLLILWGLGAAAGRVRVAVAWRHLAPGAAIFALLILWFFVQAGGLTPPRLDHPIWSQAADALQMRLDGAISLSPQAGITGVMRLLAYGGVFFLALQYGRSADRARAMFWALCLAGLAYALYGLVIEFGRINTILWFERWAYAGSLTSSFVNRNSYGSYAGLSLVVTLALMNASVGRSLQLGLRTRTGFLHFIDNLSPRMFLLMVAFVVIATALLLSRSRGALLATAIGIGAFFAMLAVRRHSRTGTLVGYVVAIAVAGAVLVSFSGSATLSRFADLATDGSGRGAVFQLTARAIGDHPLLGTGLGGFRGVFQIYRDATFDVQVPAYQQAHSSYLELALDAGLPAFAGAMALLAGIAAWCVRGILRRKRNLAYPAAGLGVTALVAAHAAVDFSLQIPAIAVTYMALMGTAVGQSFGSRQPVGRSRDDDETKDSAGDRDRRG